MRGWARLGAMLLGLAVVGVDALAVDLVPGDWIGEWLVVGPTGQSGRNPILVDGLTDALARGTLPPPEAGGEVAAADGSPRRWEPAQAGDDGWLKHAALRGGHAWVQLHSDTAQTLLLEASGHRWVECNGERHVGDPYQAGYVRVPVRLRAGDNGLLFGRVRGRVRARLMPMGGDAQFNSDDLTLPDVVAGEPIEAGTTLTGAVIVIHGGKEPLTDATILARVAGAEPAVVPVPVIERRTLRKVPFAIRLPAEVSEGALPVQLELHRAPADGEPLDACEIQLRVRGPGQVRKRTFVSGIDGSVQYYAVRPSSGDGPQALFLSLHGASVEATGQARAYAAKDWGHVVAPTNRRPYGFDWEDWGRWDALEVLEQARSALEIDSARIYLTGHSMGGHGTWHLGVTFPDQFAAIGPSAGWASFWSYAGAPQLGTEDAVEVLMRRATHPSDTVELAENLQRLGVYILHGDADDNVPVEQARLMRKRLAEFHPDFASFEQPGAGHWWGNRCVDWPEMFAFFKRRERRLQPEVRSVRFRTASPGVSARSDWLQVEMQGEPLAFSDVAIDVDPGARRFTGRTANITRMALDLNPLATPTSSDTPACLAPGAPLTLALDGAAPLEVGWPAAGVLVLRHDTAGWQVSAPAPPAWKGPHRYGPFKQVFGNRALLVYGTVGSAAENAWSLARARFDAETFWYRGNGSFNVLADVAYDPLVHAGRHVVLYGHAESNAAWPRLLESSPVQVRRGSVQVGEQRWVGDDLAVLLVRPISDDDRALVGVVGGSGMTGLRATAALPYFVSGVAYPDCTVLRARALRDGIPGVVCAGYFDERWDVAPGTFAWRGGMLTGD